MTKSIVKNIEKISGKYSPAEVFYDFVRMGAIAYHNSIRIDDSLEKDYLNTIAKYRKEDQLRFSDMLADLVHEMARRPRDVLGDIYMSMNMGNDKGGQFFTPFELSDVAIGVLGDDVPEDGPIRIYEPCCGSGSMIIAYANKLQKNGINYQCRLYVLGEEIDQKGVWMTYLQLSLLGIKAIITRKDVLTDESGESYMTPAYQLEMPWWQDKR